jgi:hypothetical protein
MRLLDAITLMREYSIPKLKERIIIIIVWALPVEVAYWAALRLLAHATVKTNLEPHKVNVVEALEHWSNDFMGYKHASNQDNA